jgi:hypothetical protein
MNLIRVTLNDFSCQAVSPKYDFSRLSLMTEKPISGRIKSSRVGL